MAMFVGLAEGVLVSALLRLVSTTYIFALGALFGGFDLFRRRGELIG